MALKVATNAQLDMHVLIWVIHLRMLLVLLVPILLFWSPLVQSVQQGIDVQQQSKFKLIMSSTQTVKLMMPKPEKVEGT